VKYKFPEDDWVSLSSNLDCNLWTDDKTGKKYLSVYEVIDGQTQATFSLATYDLAQVKEIDDE
jgi:hypothetical protein